MLSQLFTKKFLEKLLRFLIGMINRLDELF